MDDMWAFSQNIWQVDCDRFNFKFYGFMNEISNETIMNVSEPSNYFIKRPKFIFGKIPFLRIDSDSVNYIRNSCILYDTDSFYQKSRSSVFTKMMMIHNM